MPDGVGNAFAFQIFNTISFSIVLTTPMLLYFKSLGASGTVLGIVTALPALLNILQMPAARFVEQIGYRAFVLRGWSTRSVFILGMAGVAFLPAKIDPTTKMALMLFLLFAYNTSRGISVCGYLPWITQWIPEGVRGRYLSRDQMCSAVATVATLLATAGYLHHGNVAANVWSGVSRKFCDGRRQSFIPAAHPGRATTARWGQAERAVEGNGVVSAVLPVARL